MPSIFFTRESFVLAFPLLAVCSIYAFFKFIPLEIGIPIVGISTLLFQARAKLIASRSTDEHIDQTIVRDLVSGEDALVAQQEAKEEKKQRKLDQRKMERLKAERRKAANNKRETADDDDDGEMMAKFAKGSRKTK
mmetsp:Transcript_34525/g.62126  ORF Transcript_34525/g.62126 Transcript_34525/m.62126 type:complete len:136 (+) Transcript_34525:129-536(+)|eukprot:CAMPEP_0201873812 /NCGR_PEP_ID=MMETSP0902-20130614/6216_1 /ASSEMBLY_ACC=CAM_ASM_000551 /TAXON_ID=420261 /ORGANISM="Thalassiosira antarctica, Strain CCMP982" /LENGTH=135 /DNA_ID=CAMNT_0048400497 /DNA_START=105 /DNA_END=512 /DNA_ORIENTATION=-